MTAMADRERCRFTRCALAAVAVLVIALGAGSATTLASSGGRPRWGPGATGAERWDLVGEKATGGLRASLGLAIFPARVITLEVPRTASFSTGAIHVLEDGTDVAGVSVTAEGGDATHVRYRLSYISRRPVTEREVETAASVTGVGAVDLDYNAAAAVAAFASRHKSFWSSAAAIVAVACAGSIFIALALIALLVPRTRHKAIRSRVREFTTATLRPGPDDAKPSGVSRFRIFESLLTRLSWWARFSEEVEIAGFDRSPVDLVVVTLLPSVAVAVLLEVLLHNAIIPVLVFPLAALALHSLVRRRLLKTRNEFADQLGPHIEELASAMRAGHGLVAGLTAMVHSASEPSRGEWGRVLADERLGRPLEAAMESLATRMDSDDARQVALVASLHQRTGGNMAEVLDRVADAVRDRADLRRELVALTAQARLSRWVVTLLPPGVMVVIEVVNPGYLRPLINTTGGNIALAVGAVLLITGSLVMRLMTEIKV